MAPCQQLGSPSGRRTPAIRQRSPNPGCARPSLCQRAPSSDEQGRQGTQRTKSEQECVSQLRIYRPLQARLPEAQRREWWRWRIQQQKARNRQRQPQVSEKQSRSSPGIGMEDEAPRAQRADREDGQQPQVLLVCYLQSLDHFSLHGHPHPKGRRRR